MIILTAGRAVAGAGPNLALSLCKTSHSRWRELRVQYAVVHASSAALFAPQPALAPLHRHRQRRQLRRTEPPAAVAAAAAAAVLQEGWPLWTAFAICAALGQVVERRTPVGAVLSAPLVSMLLALGAAAAGVLPASSGAADAIWTYLMPTGAACYLLESDLSQLVGSAGPTMVAFFVGAVGTLLGTVVAYALVGRQLGPDGWKVAAALCASYIGGALNFAAVSQALTLAPGPLLAGAMTADNCVMALYIACIMSIPAEDCRKAAAASSAAAAAAGAADARAAAVAAAGSSAPPAAPAITAETLALSLAAAALACWLGNSLAATAGFASCGMAVMALLASAFGMLASRLLGRGGSSSSSEAPAAPFAGAEAMGGAFMMLFFATIGASAGSLQALKGAGWLAAFILLQLSVHLSVCLAGGRLLRLPMQAVLVASNANVGGPATAAAMASSKGWPHMIQPAMLTGSLGYAVATALGLGMARWLSTWYVF